MRALFSAAGPEGSAAEVWTSALPHLSRPRGPGIRSNKHRSDRTDKQQQQQQQQQQNTDKGDGDEVARDDPLSAMAAATEDQQV